MCRAPAAGRLPGIAPSGVVPLGVAPPGVEEGNVLTTPVYAPKPGGNIRGRYLRNEIQKVQEGQEGQARH